MPNPDRLAELQRQRALIATHLAWLDGEIARARAADPAAAPPTTVPESAPAPVVDLAPAEDAAAEMTLPADERKPPPSKLGCWLVFTALMALAGLLLTLLVYLRYGVSR